MCNKKKKTINSLKRHQTELNQVTTKIQGDTWKASLKDTVYFYLGPDSSILSQLENLHFTRQESSSVSGALGFLTIDVYDETKKEDFKLLINHVISNIESNGIYMNNSKSNFLSGFDNSKIISGTFAAMFIIFGIGYYYGGLEQKREIIQLDRDIYSRDQKIKNYEEGRDTVIKTMKNENKNLKETNENIYSKNDSLNMVVEDLTIKIKKLTKKR
jgi:hypothetical protein